MSVNQGVSTGIAPGAATIPKVNFTSYGKQAVKPG